MGAFDGKTTSDFAFSEETRSQSNFSMENGFGNMVDKFAGLGVNASSNDSLFQVIKAVEAAESTIRQQVEDNNNLRIQLQKRTEELERYKSDTSAAPGLQSDNLVDDQILGPYRDRRSVSHIGNQADRFKWIAGASLLDPQHTLALEQNIISKYGEYTPPTHLGSDQFSGQLMNGNMYMLRNGRSAVDNANSSHLSSTSSRSHSPSRYQIEGEYDPKFNSPQDRRITTPDINHQDTAWKQDLVVKFREHDEEILQLRKQLSDYSMKEAQLRNEKYVLEKRIAYMRMAFDQQQQDLVEAASKAISYRQDIIEENIRLTYALQAAQQERSTFISSLLPLLVEYSLQPSVPDALSIVNNLKVLFKHLQEKLLVTEEKLKEFNYQLAPWRSDAWNHSSFTSQSPHRAIPTELNTSHENRHELVPQSYSHREAPISHSNAQIPTTRDRMGDYTHHSSPINVAENNLEPENVERSSPTLSRNAQDVSQGGSHAKHFTPKTMDEQLSFTNLVRSREMDDSYKVDYQNGGEPSTQWVSQNSSYINPAPDDPSPSFSPHLPPVMEETSSSFSEDVEEDPLPAVEGLQISGEAYPGRELQASGYSVNGTTSCNFEWVRYLEDGSVIYIEGAKQPTYLVTADDVDSYLAIEVQPLDNRKRKGELVKVFANDQRKITCDSEMQEQIEKTLYSGNASYEVSLAAGYMDIWEPAILAIKRQGYSIKCNGTRGVVVTEKFSPRTAVIIPYGHATTFSIIGSGGMEHLLRTTDNSSFRDVIVLTMRLFIAKAVEKRKGKKRGLFFNK